MYKVLHLLLISIHHLGILGFLLSTPLLIINEPFWVWVPLNTWILHLILSPVLVCPLTVWENRLRDRLGKSRIKSFVKHYYIKPFVKWKNNR